LTFNIEVTGDKSRSEGMLSGYGKQSFQKTDTCLPSGRAETLACPISNRRTLDESNFAGALRPKKILTKPPVVGSYRLDKALPACRRQGSFPAESAKSPIIPRDWGITDLLKVGLDKKLIFCIQYTLL
jgi:hypothetical protein